MNKRPVGDDIAAICIFAIGAIAIGMLMPPSILNDIARAIVSYAYYHQAS